MATTMTLSELMVAVRQRADMLPTGYSATLNATSYFVTDPELISYINQSYFELYDLLVQEYGDDYFVADPYSITTDGVNDHFSLPADFYKLLGVDLGLSGTGDSYVTLRKFNFSDRNKYSVPNFQSFYGVTNLKYRLSGSKIWFTPIPSASQNIRLFYVPRLSPLAALSTTVDGISGWTEYIIIDAAIKCMQKEESDVSVLMAQKMGIIQRITNAAENRDAANPSQVADTQSSDFWFPSGNGAGWGNF